MTLQQLMDVIAVADAGSFSRGAEKLFISQPSLSSAVRELEKELDMTLFRRTGRGADLTAEGEAFLPYARSVIAQFESLQAAFTRQGVRKERFAVSTQHYSFAVRAFVEVTQDLDVAEYELAIRETRTRQVMEDVASSRSELGILYLSDFNRDVLSRMLADLELLFHPLVSCRASVYLWRSHPLAGREAITFSDLLPYPCLAFEQGGDSPFYLAEEILSCNPYPRVITCSDRATMLNLMVGVLGYTLCSGIICRELNGDDFVAVPYAGDEENPNSVMQLGYITRKNTVPSPLGRKYIAALCRYLETVPHL